jgi:hypothetical protein
MLFNPVTRQMVADRPEERVRLRTIEFLCRRAGFSLNRMNTEQGLHRGFGGSSMQRTDIVCFDGQHRPLLLVECKAEGVKIDEKVAIQSAQYNRSVQAPYILLTNGVTDVLMAIKEEDQVEVLTGWERVSELITESQRDSDYWEQRGFVNAGADGLSNAATQWLTRLYSGDGAQNQYVQVPVPGEVLWRMSGVMRPMVSQYLRVYPREESGARQAIGLVSGLKRVSGGDNPNAFFVRIVNNPALNSPKWDIWAAFFHETKLELRSAQPNSNSTPVFLQLDYPNPTEQLREYFL